MSSSCDPRARRPETTFPPAAFLGGDCKAAVSSGTAATTASAKNTPPSSAAAAREEEEEARTRTPGFDFGEVNASVAPPASSSGRSAARRRLAIFGSDSIGGAARRCGVQVYYLINVSLLTEFGSCCCC
mmetsp:Transcript_46809/g.99367  ORF Transcript_46809/g.99367 Transcript_46809/m.99367 type:complete len:129 (+) Transcript_46809:1981-2367(+)